MAAAGGGAAPSKYLNSRNPAIKRLMREYAEFQADPNPSAAADYVAAPLDDNLFEWHFTLRGAADTEFEGGRYHGRILLPSEYPFKPPDIVLLTPSGRFAVNEKICLSISSFHPKNWQPSWSIRTVLVALIAFFPTPGAGAIGSLDAPIAERKACARRSADWRCDLCAKTNAQMLPALPPAPKPAAGAAAAAPAPGAAAAATGAAAGSSAADRLVADLISNLKAAAPGQPLPPPVPPSPAATPLQRPASAFGPLPSPPLSPAPPMPGAAASPAPTAPAAAPTSPVHGDGVDDEGWATAPVPGLPANTSPALLRKASSTGARTTIPLTSRLISGGAPSLTRTPSTAGAAAAPAAATRPMSLTGASPAPAAVGAAVVQPSPQASPGLGPAALSGAAGSTGSAAAAANSAATAAGSGRGSGSGTIIASFADFQVPPQSQALPPGAAPLLGRQWSTPTLGMTPDTPAHAVAPAIAAAAVAAPRVAVPLVAATVPAVAPPVAVAAAPAPAPAAASASALAPLSAEQLALREQIRREREVKRQKRERLLSNLTVTIAALILLILLRKLLAYSQRHQF